MSKNSGNIDFSIVETKRPKIYTALKYWGKKPHNVWNAYIKKYTKDSNVFLDPFCGSCISAFEAAKLGKKAIAIDINPLSSFIIEVFCSKFEPKEFVSKANEIIEKIKADEIYQHLYQYKNKYNNFYVQNVKWENNVIYEVCIESLDKSKRICLSPENEDYDAVSYADKIRFFCPIENIKFRDSISFPNKFKETIGDNFSDLYTNRNAYVLSKIFEEIIKVHKISLKKQLLFSFIQTVHLSTKMCVPRAKSANRDFSTSWGRSAYLNTKKQMEMNPLILFENNCFGKTSTLKILNYSKQYFTKEFKIANISEQKIDLHKDIDIWYGVYNSKNISNIIPAKSVDFVLTDPPYGGLVQYLDLSNIWLSWLSAYDKKYLPDYNSEITINLNKNEDAFKKDMSKVLKEINFVLKDNAKLVLTFNSKDLRIWKSFLLSIKEGGFAIEKIVFQQNKRSGESNVSDKYGMSGSDFYIRCIKSVKREERSNVSKFDREKMLVSLVKEVLLKRMEPTPYQILFNCVLTKIHDPELLDLNINCLENFLALHNEFFVYKKASNTAGNLWWLRDVNFNINNRLSITSKIKNTIISILKENESINDETIKQKIYKLYTNEYIPDFNVLENLLHELAKFEKGKWRLK